jgi:hypothetical protein
MAYSVHAWTSKRLLIVPAEMWSLICYCRNADPQWISCSWILAYVWLHQNSSWF